MPELSRFETALLHRLAVNTAESHGVAHRDDGLTIEVPVSCLALAALERLLERDGQSVEAFAEAAIVDAVERMPNQGAEAR